MPVVVLAPHNIVLVSLAGFLGALQPAYGSICPYPLIGAAFRGLVLVCFIALVRFCPLGVPADARRMLQNGAARDFEALCRPVRPLVL